MPISNFWLEPEPNVYSLMPSHFHVSYVKVNSVAKTLVTGYLDIDYFEFKTHSTLGSVGTIESTQPSCVSWKL
jgi:hypothetical protein